ncbi:nickel-dependent lactate racemase [Hoeflea sp. G2-23]|uniref:Nickel-dependent lactate racemase n=1 Tax=Hoeflea algicola TaxID=2983763 RepID=A0ABT3Z5Z9_9HYPH|nr:nickel-dependent lactate racemase [Hoeflea algicola]MCY0147134.1 nickel-dependent lactate racemase [Hoeflea algicola]
MQIEMAYGQKGMMLDVPAGIETTIIRRKPLPVPDDPARVIEMVLANPISAAPLSEAARGAKTACILICDITRPVPNRLFLRPVIEQLTAAGVPLSGITVLVATGLHRPNLDDELAELVGDRWVLENVTCVNHYAREDADHVMLGTTPGRGVPVGIDKRFVEADIRIATGLVEPHFMAGYSGGRKVIAPGVAHHSTIRTFHSARFMEDPAASSCNLDNNPLHEEQLEIVRMLGGTIYGLNTVLDEHRNLIFASFGEIIESHMAAVDFVRDSIEVRVPRKFGLVVTSAAGYPLDRTYYQTVKGMVTPIDILAEGGTLMIVSECGEGIGSEEFRAAQQRLVTLGPDAFLKTLLKKDFADIDEWQTEMQLKPMRLGTIVLVAPELSEQDRAVTGVECHDDLNTAVRLVLARTGLRELAVVPEGPYVVPFYEAAE